MKKLLWIILKIYSPITDLITRNIVDDSLLSNYKFKCIRRLYFDMAFINKKFEKIIIYIYLYIKIHKIHNNIKCQNK
jgi:hypothetical protein